MHRTLALYKKELRSYFATPLFYVVATVFLSLCGLFFYADLNFFTQFGFGMDILNNFFQLLFVDMATKGMTFTVPLLTMRLFAEPFAFRVVGAGYAGLIFLGMVFIAIGLFVSSLTDSQVVAGVGSLFLVGLLWAMSWNEAAGSDQVMRVVKGFSTFDHFWNFSKGIIDSTDVLYFLFVTIFFANLTLRSLESRHWRGR
jgi:ABC-2 type transport system permease protein